MNPEGPLDTTVAIEAPEQIRFRYRLAGPAQRAMAHVIDLLILAGSLLAIAIVAVITGVLSPALEGDGFAKAGIGVLLVVVFLAQWGYFALFEGLNRGRTPGKAALALRVVKAGGEPVGLMDAVLRNLLRAADLLPTAYAAGVVTMLIDPRFRRLGDLVAGTMVVVEDRLRMIAPVHIAPPTAWEAQALPARVVLSADEQRAIELLLRRANELGPALSGELAGTVAQALGRKHGYEHPDPVRLLALLYLRATGPAVYRGPGAPALGAVAAAQGTR